ncbi:MAG: hypothetical protein RR061_00065 [Muribaculaceae bacterium]
MTNISEFLQQLLEHYKSADIAESEFIKMMHEDEGLKSSYKEWCDDLGYSIKTGYAEYIEELIENQESIWDSLSEDDDL